MTLDKIFSFAYLISNKAKFYLEFFRYYINGVVLLNKLHAGIGLMGGTKMCILIRIKRRCQCKARRERFTPYQSEGPKVPNCFVLYLNDYSG